MSKLGYYNVESFTKLKMQKEKGVKVPPQANVLAAANHMRGFFEGKKFAYAFFGGLEMMCLGHRRELLDLHVTYDHIDFQKIKAKLEKDQRYCCLRTSHGALTDKCSVRLPEGINSLFPAKLLIRTGPEYKDEGCAQSVDIEVDLVPPGA